MHRGVTCSAVSAQASLHLQSGVVGAELACMRGRLVHSCAQSACSLQQGCGGPQTLSGKRAAAVQRGKGCCQQRPHQLACSRQVRCHEVARGR